MLVLTASALPAGAARLPRLLTEDFGTTFAIAPPVIVISGDGSALLAGEAAWIGRDPTPKHTGNQFGHITWTSWTATRATGTGVAWLDNCTPDCAQGTYFPHDERIVASTVQAGRFTRLVLTPTGPGKATIYTLKRGGGGYIWG